LSEVWVSDAGCFASANALGCSSAVRCTIGVAEAAGTISLVWFFAAEEVVAREDGGRVFVVGAVKS